MDFFSSGNTASKMDQIMQLLSLSGACTCMLIIQIKDMTLINLFYSSFRNDFK